jgi:hypothetical protein
VSERPSRGSSDIVCTAKTAKAADDGTQNAFAVSLLLAWQSFLAPPANLLQKRMGKLFAAAHPLVKLPLRIVLSEKVKDMERYLVSEHVGDGADNAAQDLRRFARG